MQLSLQARPSARPPLAVSSTKGTIKQLLAANYNDRGTGGVNKHHGALLLVAILGAGGGIVYLGGKGCVKGDNGGRVMWKMGAILR